MGKSNAWILDITNPDYQDYITTRLAEALAYYRIDGHDLRQRRPASAHSGPQRNA